MNTKKTIHLVVATVVGLSHLTVVSVARAEELRAIERIAAAQADVDELAKQIDLALSDQHGEISGLETASEKRNAKREARVARIERRLKKREFRLVSRYQARIDRMSDAEVAAEASRVRDFADAGGNLALVESVDRAASDPAGLRQTLKDGFRKALSESIPVMAEEIVAQGGTVPFLLKAKKVLKRLKGTNLAEVSKKADRAPAADTVFLIVGIAVLLVGVACALFVPVIGMFAAFLCALGGTGSLMAAAGID